VFIFNLTLLQEKYAGLMSTLLLLTRCFLSVYRFQPVFMY